MKKQRKHYTPEEKVAILRRHLLEQVPISELCDKQGLQPTVFYRWQKEFFRERSGCLPTESAAQPLSRAGANLVPGEEDPDQGRGSGGADGGARRAKKNAWGTLTGVWVPHDTRDQIVDFVRRCHAERDGRWRKREPSGSFVGCGEDPIEAGTLPIRY